MTALERRRGLGFGWSPRGWITWAGPGNGWIVCLPGPPGPKDTRVVPTWREAVAHLSERGVW